MRQDIGGAKLGATATVAITSLAWEATCTAALLMLHLILSSKTVALLNEPHH